MTRYRTIAYFVVLCSFPVVFLGSVANASDDTAHFLRSAATKPFDVIRSYLQALQAHDSRAAYSYISASDRSVRDESTYIKSQDTFDGFALKLARWFAAEMQVWVINQRIRANKAHFEIGYKIPAGDEVASQLFGWNGSRLNTLPEPQQQQLIATLNDLKRSGKMLMIEGRETIDLARERNGWKISLDWPARVRVLFRVREPAPRVLAVRFQRNDLLVDMKEPFQIDFTVKNHGADPIIARLNHIIEPNDFTPNVYLIACGLSSPFTIQPNETREFSSSYLLVGNVAARSRFTIIYDFRVRSTVANTP
jgi:hypothetical protein